MNKEFVPYDIALAMRELEFKGDCFGCYTKDKELSLDRSDNKGDGHYFQDCSAPLYQQAFDWFRIEHNLDAEIYMNNSIIDNGKFYTFTILRLDGGIVNHVAYAEDRLDTYDIARDACIKKLTDLVKDSKMCPICEGSGYHGMILDEEGNEEEEDVCDRCCGEGKIKIK